MARTILLSPPLGDRMGGQDRQTIVLGVKRVRKELLVGESCQQYCPPKFIEFKVVKWWGGEKD
jgi:hypothetical protein